MMRAAFNVVLALIRIGRIPKCVRLCHSNTTHKLIIYQESTPSTNI